MKTLGGHMDNVQLPAEVRDHKTLEMTAACGVTAPQHFSAHAVRGEKQQIGRHGLRVCKQDLSQSHRGSTSEAFFKEAETSTPTGGLHPRVSPQSDGCPYQKFQREFPSDAQPP